MPLLATSGQNFIIKGIPQIERDLKKTRVSKTPAGGFWDKTKEVAKKIFITIFVVAGTVVGNAITLGIPTILRHCSYLKKRDVKKEIESRRIEHLQTALKCGLEGESKWKPLTQEITKEQLFGSSLKAGGETQLFLNAVDDLRKEISQLNNKVRLGSVENVYKKLQDLASDIRFMAVFRTLEASDHPAVNFLKLLSVKFRSAKMTDILIGRSKEQLGIITPDQEPGYSIGKTGEVIRDFRKEPSFCQNFFWAISHPTNWFHSCESKWLQRSYDSNESNPTYTTHEIEYRRKDKQTISARFTAGPTPFNDEAYKQIFLSEGRELRFNIMDTAKGEEHGWIEGMERCANQSKGHLEHVVLGFVTKEKRGYLDATNVDSLINGYKQALLTNSACRSIQHQEKDNGVVIPQTLLSDDQIKKACTHAKALIEELNPELSEKKMRHAVLVIVDTMMALGIMINYLEGLKGLIEDKNIDEDMRAVYIATACKQCYDRGPVYVAALQLFFRSLSDPGPLTEDEFYQITGFPLFRAPLGEGREQQKGKFEVYEAFAKMLGPNMATLSKHTQAFCATLN